MRPPLMVIDGLNLFFRHFAANPTMSDNGSHAGGIVGFLRAMQHLVSLVGPREMVVVWESGGSSRRRALFPDYKKGKRPHKLNRFYDDDIPETLENLDDQVSLLISLLRFLPVRQIYVPDCEADDIIGYIAKHLAREEPAVVVSSDRDLHQLICSRVVQWTPGRKKFVNSKSVIDEYGIHPVNFCTARAFGGDTSDGIPGVQGAGFKTLSKRFPELGGNEFVSVESIIEISRSRLLEKPRLKLYDSIVSEADVAARNWRLMYLDTSNLAAHQVKSLVDSWEQPAPGMQKLQFVRAMGRFGIKKFDADYLFADFKANIRSTG